MQYDIQPSLQKLAQLTHDYCQQQQIEQPILVGIKTGGVWVAEWLQAELNISQDIGVLDISFYRDDFTRHGLNPEVGSSDLPISIENRDILLVDDVVMSGRTVRAAMNELFDYGRPARIHLLTLFDVGQRELPIAAQVTGEVLQLAPNQRIQLTGPKPLGAEIVQLHTDLAE